MKIGACFPALDFETMELDKFLSYIMGLRTNGVDSFDFFIDFFIEMDHKKERLLNFFKSNDIGITMHYQGYMKDAYNKLEIVSQNINVNYIIPVVFHLPSYDKDKYDHIRQIVSKINKLLEHKSFDILIETLSKNHPNNQNLGDDISEINLFLKLIPDSNFGICWDLGHTRINHLEEKSNLYLNDISRVKMTHIHNFYYKNKFVDHIPFHNLDNQDEEIKYLIKNGYKGVYSLEFPLNNLKENIDVYIDSIRKLKILIEEEKYEFWKISKLC